MKRLFFILLFLLFTIKSEATLVEKFFDYNSTSTVTDVNLNGNIDNIIRIINGDFDNSNIRTATHRLYELLGAVPAAGTQGRIVYNTVENTLNFDTGSSWFTSPTYTGTAANGEMLYYDGTNWNRTSNTIYISGGNVGIGNSAPLGRLQVGTTPSVPLLIIKDSGNVGIGTSTPIAKLQIAGNIIAPTGSFTTLTTTIVDGNITANIGTFSTLKFGTQVNTLPSGTAPSGSLLVNDGTGTVSWGAGRRIYTSDDTFVAPAGVTIVYLTMVGGGGGGGKDRGGGGGGGGALVKYPYTVVPGNSYTVDVGAAGSAGTVGNGGAGANTTFNTSVIAYGGAGGTGPTGNGGAGGTEIVAIAGTAGTPILISGGTGGNYSSNTGGGGGGSIWGAGGTASDTGIVGGAGQGYGGGGGGGGNGANGGAGAAGLVIVEY